MLLYCTVQLEPPLISSRNNASYPVHATTTTTAVTALASVLPTNEDELADNVGLVGSP